MTKQPSPPPDDSVITGQLGRRAGAALDVDARDHLVDGVLRATAASAGSRQARWPRLLLPLAATLTIALVVVAIAWSPLAQTVGTPSGSPPAGSGDATAAPPSANPFTVDGVLTLDQLQAAVTQSLSHGTPQTVVADVSLEVDQIDQDPSCAAAELCTVGRLIGVQPGLTVLADPEVRAYVTSTHSGTVLGPLALRLGRGAPELLGVVQINPDGTLNVKGDLLWPAAETSVSSLETGTPGSVIAVHGFLVWSGPIPCPGEPSPTAPPDGPFDNCPWAWITPQAYQPYSGNTMTGPQVAIQVQWEAYDEFTPKGTESAHPSPVEGTYLLRLVADPRSNCNPCRGWKVVGTVDQVSSSPSPSPSPSVVEPVVRTATEMSTLLRENGNAWIGHVMLVQGDIVPMGGPPCTAKPTDCPIGAFDGSDERLYPVAGATPSSVPDGGLSGTFAVRVRESGLDLLGPAQLNGSEVLWSPNESAVVGQEAGAPGTLIVVHGWLGWSGAVPCVPPTLPTPPPDTPFDTCPAGWIGSAPSTPVSGVFNAPSDAIRINWTAINQFGDGSDTVEGTFILRLVEDPRPNADPKRGWQVAARLDADPVSPVTSPSAELTDPVILSPDQLRSAVAGHLGARLQPLDVIADVSIDMAAGVTAVDCPDKFESCDEIGTIHDAVDLGTVLRREDADVQISQNVSSPIALRINDHGVLVFLGHVNGNTSGDGTFWWTVPRATAAAATLPENELIVVAGWLAGNLETCGPAVAPPPSPPAYDPFQCYGGDYLEEQAEQLYGVGGSTTSVPTGAALKLGVNEYNWEAPDPSQNLAPRQGVYLVKSVVNHSNLESQACTGCRGWLIVGRVQPTDLATIPPEPTPTASPPGPSATPVAVVEPPSPSPSVDASAPSSVLTVDELRALLNETRAAPVDVVANVTIDPDFHIDCVPAEPCPTVAGFIRELPRTVFAADHDPYPDQTLQDLSAPVALHIGTDGVVTFLGHVDLSPQTGLAWTVPTAPILQSTPLGHVLAVSGWLSTQAGRNGPMVPPGNPPPFDAVWTDLLAPGSKDTSDVPEWASGPDFIRTQQGAYMQFAPGDHSNDGQPPQVGTYLVEHVAYQGGDVCTPACDGWLMVGRLDPSTLSIDELNAALVPGQTSFPVSTVANVRGWLVDSGAPIPCPAYPLPVTPPTSPWEPGCSAAWIAANEEQPVTGSFGSWTFQDPPSSVQVQPDAYGTFAADPKYEVNGFAHVPRLGTYTLQLIRDPRFPVDGALGWEVVARVDP